MNSTAAASPLRRSRLGLEAETLGDEKSLGQVEEPLDDEGEARRRNRPLEDQAHIIEANPGEDRLAVAARADEGA